MITHVHIVFCPTSRIKTIKRAEDLGHSIPRSQCTAEDCGASNLEVHRHKVTRLVPTRTSPIGVL